jgi:hypothetical protein
VQLLYHAVLLMQEEKIWTKIEFGTNGGKQQREI